MLIHSELRRAIENDNVVFFLGAGFSKDLGFPDWSQLVKNIVTEVGKNDDAVLSFIPLIQRMTPIKVLEEIKNEKKIIRKILGESFIIDDEKLKKIECSRKYDLVWKISKKIITTNYDKSLEKSNREIEDAYIPPDDDSKLSDFISKNKFYFKIHGCISSPAKCVLLKEDYEDLYNNNKLAKFQLENIITNKTIVFLGFSLSDPYVNYVFESMHKLFNGYNNKHFIVTINNEDFKEYGVENIQLNNWNEMDGFLEELLKIKQQNEPVVSLINSSEIAFVNDSKKENIKVAVLTANPLDRKIDFKDEILKIDKVKCQIDHYALNMDNIRNCNDYDYLFVLSDEVKGKLVIENEVLTSRLITLKEFEDNICNGKLKGILILTKNNNSFNVEEQLSEGYMLLNKAEKNDLDTLMFKLFRKKIKSVDIKTINDDKIKLIEINEELKISKTKSTYLSEKIDKKNLKNFVGRETDFREVIKKIFELKSDEKVLVLKGAGGLGKTTLIKKIALELSERGAFKDGIYFFDCEFIKSADEFQREIAKAFGLEQEIDFFNYIYDNQKNKDALLIIDNFETILYSKEINEIKNIISKTSDYITIVITSREVLSLDYEDIYEIRSFNIDEAEELFYKEINYKLKLSEKEKKILREDILEYILGKNPLAINLIAPHFIKGLSIKYFKDDLSKNLSEMDENFDIEETFKKSDRNIEKRKTLVSSISFSYSKLVNTEKFIFEILSLFQNGIYIENLKMLVNRGNNKLEHAFRLNLADIISLEKKSLIENNNGNIRLQSIVFKFAEKKLNNRENIANFYLEAFEYNDYILRSIVSNDKKIYGLSYFTQKNLEKNYRNFIKVFEFLNKIDIANDLKIEYIINLFNSVSFLNRFSEFKNYLLLTESIYLTKNEKDFFEVNKLFLDYFLGNFDDVLYHLNTNYEIRKLLYFKTSDKIEYYILQNILNIYEMSGIPLNEYKFIKIDKKLASNFESYLFRIGEYTDSAIIKDRFFILEKEYNLGTISLNDVEDTLKNTHEDDALEILQINYIKVKMKSGKRSEIEKLISINSYTKGLKFLMFALLEVDLEKADFYYKNALKNLRPIKYYYVEGLYFYAKFLKKNLFEEEYNEILNFGLELSEDFTYRFHLHNFLCLKNDINKEYDVNEYPIKDEESKLFIENIKKELK